MNIIFQIDGGIGKSVMATAVCRAIKKQYPDDNLIVLTGYPEVFLCNPFVEKVFQSNNLNYFYQDFVRGQTELKTFLHNPYLDNAFIKGEGHLIEVWCRMFGVPYSGEQPELFLTDREKKFYGKLFFAQRPILLLQTNGGGANQPNKYSWMRDLPQATAQRVVNALKEEYQIVHIRRQDQPALEHTTPIQADFRALAVLIGMSAKRLLIDSFAQHTAAAMGKHSVVCWIGNQPEQFGYPMHTNIVANPPTLKPELRYSVFTRYNIAGQPTEFPYNNEDEIFDVARIIAELKKDDQDYTLTDKINQEAAKGSMVAHRLQYLEGKVSLDDVTQILDIGSWHLNQSLEFATLFPQARIDAFEPVPESYDLCVKKLQEQDTRRRENIHIHNRALSNENGPISFYSVDTDRSSGGVDAGFASMFKVLDTPETATLAKNLVQKEVKTQAQTLDSWCATNGVTRVDIMWMDAQGSELKVLQGADAILKNTRIIMTEVGLKPYYEGHTLKNDIDDFLKQRGFVELESSLEMNIIGFEANTIYIRSTT